MQAYLKIEESYATQDNSLRSDLMGVSLLALFISPWAIIGLALSIFGVSFVTPVIVAVCMGIIIAAIPQALQQFHPNPEKDMM
ncbi:hypothetical protein MMIC_P1775 [Mariprofundus micogutta]|uniref:Uncharacterized protein n=1 Tax=Mariprofundus micogutta TaxID=1921010 RepID=A0A1L8CPF1_9PROT|nr:hypothetical protein [Mariprofundus micogutta]GAV20801.1 hypothetical protein MMIC_P1775 [Mariprofundus micogutta]